MDNYNPFAPDKNPFAVALGRRGGKKGGPAAMAAMTSEEKKAFHSAGGKAAAAKRAKTLTKEQRIEIAKKAVATRWAKAKAKERK